MIGTEYDKVTFWSISQHYFSVYMPYINMQENQSYNIYTEILIKNEIYSYRNRIILRLNAGI